MYVWKIKFVSNCENSEDVEPFNVFMETTFSEEWKNIDLTNLSTNHSRAVPVSDWEYEPHTSVHDAGLPQWLSYLSLQVAGDKIAHKTDFDVAEAAEQTVVPLSHCC